MALDTAPMYGIKRRRVTHSVMKNRINDQSNPSKRTPPPKATATVIPTA